MKNIEKYISVLLAIQMILVCMLVPSALASDIAGNSVEVREAILAGDESELIPMEANDCCTTHVFDSVDYLEQCSECNQYYGVELKQCRNCPYTVAITISCACVPDN